MEQNLLQEFGDEAREHLDRIEPDLLSLETDGFTPNAETVNRVFRAVHSIKGSAALVGLTTLRDFSHLVENILLGLREGRLSPSTQAVDALLQAVDHLRTMVREPPERHYLPGPEQMPDLYALQREAAPRPQAVPPPPPVSRPAAAPHQTRRALLVEDNRLAGRMLAARIQADTGLVPVLAESLAQARQALEGPQGFQVAVLDLNLPDAPDGEVVDLALAHGLPAIILTATFDDDVRQRILQKRVVDYVVKGGNRDLDYVCHLINRLRLNRDVTVLVVDDTRSLRELMRGLLELQGYTVLTAEDGRQALAVYENHPEIRLVITDYNMPEMDGLQLVGRLRESTSKDRLAIIGTSAEGAGTLSAKFLKSGANDFLAKPFLNEEFHCRVNQNVEILELIQRINEASRRDFLTGLYNRRHLWEAGRPMHQIALAKRQDLAVGLLDIDFFKRVNDTHGHTAGDEALKQVANLLTQVFTPPALVARFGGEEFCVVAPGIDKPRALMQFNTLRKLVERTPVNADQETFSLTISIGLAIDPGSSLEDMIHRADELLYQAKSRGRNRVVLEG